MQPHSKRVMSLRMRELFFIADEEPVECVMSVLMVALGVWLVLPLDTFHSMTSYRPIAPYVDELITGIGVTALGTLRLFFILNNRIWPRRVLAVVFGAFWGFNAFLSMSANPGSLLTPVYGMLFCVSCWIAYRLNGRTSAK